MNEFVEKNFNVSFDDLWTLRQNNRGMIKMLQEIRKRTKSIHIQEYLIDQELLGIIEKNIRICNKYLEESKRC